jgi:hypothetical protein
MPIQRKEHAMRRHKTLAGVVAAAAAATAVIVFGGRSDAVPLTSSTGGLAVCPALGGAPIVSPDGTYCRNREGSYEVLNVGNTDVHTLQVTLLIPYRGFVSAQITEPDAFAVTVTYPLNSKLLYTGPLRFYWYVGK